MKKRKKNILVSGPSITEKEISYVARAAKTAWNEGAYKYVNKFERGFAKHLRVRYALATSSCTGALHLALLALGVGKGDEIIVPDITWIASVAPIAYLGAKPVMADIEPDTWCIDPKKIEEKITRRTKGILAVHLYGHPADMRGICAIAKKHKLFVIEDAAESLGARYRGKFTGGIGDAGVFSFHGSKTLVTGEGGMLVTNNRRLYERARFLNHHGQAKGDKMFWNAEVGYKYKMSDLQAALGLAQLSRLNELLQKKRHIFGWYKKYLAEVPGLRLNVEKPGCKNSFWMVTVSWNKDKRLRKEDVIKKMLAQNIHTRPFFYPLSALPPFKTNATNKVAHTVSPYAINLPCGLNITESEVAHVAKTFRKIVGL